MAAEVEQLLREQRGLEAEAKELAGRLWRTPLSSPEQSSEETETAGEEAAQAMAEAHLALLNSLLPAGVVLQRVELAAALVAIQEAMEKHPVGVGESAWRAGGWQSRGPRSPCASPWNQAASDPRAVLREALKGVLE